MKKDDFFFEVRTLLLQFEDAFNDIVVKRFNKSRVAGKSVHVNFVYSPKQRVLHDLINKSQHIKLPVVAITIKGIRRDVSRVFNKIDGTYWRVTNEDDITQLLQPVPIDVTINMSILARYTADMDQIIANFIPYTDPYVVVSWKVPNLTQEIRSTIVWDENISFSYPSELTQNQPWRIGADTTFTIKGWLFKDVTDPSDAIRKITTTFTSVSELHTRFATMTSLQGTLTTDTFVTSARPFISKVIPYLITTSATNQFAIIGNMFNDVTRLYVSGASLDMFAGSMLQNPLSTHNELSASYGPFSGREISGFEIDNNHTISFNLPSATSAGFADLIVLNEAGYGILTQDGIRPTTNPYPSSLPEFSTYVEPQHGSVSGIEVVAV